MSPCRVLYVHASGSGHVRRAQLPPATRQARACAMRLQLASLQAARPGPGVQQVAGAAAGAGPPSKAHRLVSQQLQGSLRGTGACAASGQPGAHCMAWSIRVLMGATPTWPTCAGASLELCTASAGYVPGSAAATAACHSCSAAAGGMHAAQQAGRCTGGWARLRCDARAPVDKLDVVCTAGQCEAAARPACGRQGSAGAHTGSTGRRPGRQSQRR